MARPKSTPSAQSSATIGFEAKLWLTADKWRNNMDAAEYKHVVLDLIFLKYISDTFGEHRAKLLAGKGDYAGANAEDPDEYKTENVFWVPAEAHWPHLQAGANQPAIGKMVHDDMVDIERWQFDVPPKGNANLAWVQHYHCALNENGSAGFVTANSASDARLVECGS